MASSWLIGPAAVAGIIAQAHPVAVQGTLRALWAGRELSRSQALGLGWAFVGLGNDPEALAEGQARFASGERGGSGAFAERVPSIRSGGQIELSADCGAVDAGVFKWRMIRASPPEVTSRTSWPTDTGTLASWVALAMLSVTRAPPSAGVMR